MFDEFVFYFKNYHVIIICLFQIGIAADAVFSLKLIQYGVSIEKITMFSVPLDFLYMLIPFFMSNYTARNNSFLMYYKFHVVGLGCVILGVIFVAVTPSSKNDNNEFSSWYFVLYMTIQSIRYCIGSIEYLAVGAIFTRVADPDIGGTYMTLLATINNLGYMYPGTLILYLIGFFTVKQCKENISHQNSTISSDFNKTVSRFIRENKCDNPILSMVNLQVTFSSEEYQLI
jgi:PAT family acetyl-CoA transporter-like MFS transporter 1